MFFKSILDEKKDIKNNLFTNELGQHLIKTVISEEISKNYGKIIKNLEKPYKNKSSEILQSLIFRDKEKIKTSYKLNPEPLSKVFDAISIKDKMEAEVKVSFLKIINRK